LGVEDAADAVESAIAATLAQSKVRTPDIGGSASTEELGAAIAAEVGRSR
jgi:isocitrate/isopropylmalate dehydrogenase